MSIRRIALNAYTALFGALALLLTQVSTAAAAPTKIEEKCDLAKELKGPVNDLAGQIIGLSGFAKVGIILAVLGLAFFASTRFRGTLVKFIIWAFAALVILSVIPGVLDSLVQTKC